MKKFKVLSRFGSVSFRMVVQNATTELHKTTPPGRLKKTHVTVLLALPGPPLSIRLLHIILVGNHFPQKINDFCLAFYINTSSMSLTKEFIQGPRASNYKDLQGILRLRTMCCHGLSFAPLEVSQNCGLRVVTGWRLRHLMCCKSANQVLSRVSFCST